VGERLPHLARGPVPVVAVRAETVKVGGAGNVAANVAAMGGQARLVTVIGADAAGERLAA